VLDTHPQVVEYAREAIRRAGIEVRERAIRGGTDGSKLSFMGLPTPNIFAGEHNFTRGSNGCRCRTWKRRSR
jgi:tripeptide aminopeptidase